MAQISLTFPDGNAREYDAGVTAAESPMHLQIPAQKGDQRDRERRTLGPAMADRRRRQHRDHTMADEEQAKNWCATIWPTSWPAPCRKSGPIPKSPSAR